MKTYRIVNAPMSVSNTIVLLDGKISIFIYLYFSCDQLICVDSKSDSNLDNQSDE